LALSLYAHSGGLRRTSRLTLLHDPLTLRSKLFNSLTEHFGPNFCSCEEFGEEFAHHGLREDQADPNQDPRPCNEGSDTGKQARSAAASNASNATAMGRRNELDQGEQAHDGEK
jgi:hypothetical protein